MGRTVAHRYAEWLIQSVVLVTVAMALSTALVWIAAKSPSGGPLIGVAAVLLWYVAPVLPALVVRVEFGWMGPAAAGAMSASAALAEWLLGARQYMFGNLLSPLLVLLIGGGAGAIVAMARLAWKRRRGERHGTR